MNPRLELAPRESALDHVVGPGFEERDAGFDVTGGRDDQDRDGLVGPRRAERTDRTGRGQALGDDEIDVPFA
jgi:hypothetical protein